MPAERIGMRDAREIIRLKSSSVSMHEIARRLGLARSTVRETLKRVDGAGLSWPLPEDMSDSALEAALYASRRSKRGHRRIEEPDWADVHRELKRKHVTLLILWDEYIAANPGGYSYSRFCELCRSFEKTLSVTMPHGADLRRRAGGIELHLRQGDLDAGAARLDRRPCARLRGDRRRSRTRRAGQRQDRHRQGQLLRS